MQTFEMFRVGGNFGRYLRYLHSRFYGTYLHGNGLFLMNIYRLYLTHAEIISKPNGSYAQLSGRCWAGTYFGRARFIGLQNWSGMSWFQWQSVEVRLDRHPRASEGRPQGFNFLGGTTTPRFRGGRYTTHWIAPYLIMLSV